MNKNKTHLPQRRSIRLKGYDYAQDGLYFITICCQNMSDRFGYIKNEEMILNEYGEIAFNEWLKLSQRFQNFELDAFQIMPNHMHGIIRIHTVRATLAVVPNILPQISISPELLNISNTPNTLQHQSNTLQNSIEQHDFINKQNTISINNGIRTGTSPTATVTASMSSIVGAYKSLVANECLKISKSKNETMGKLWQRNYYEHIIRNEQAYENISKYIINNPAKWQADKFFKQKNR